MTPTTQSIQDAALEMYKALKAEQRADDHFHPCYDCTTSGSGCEIYQELKLYANALRIAAIAKAEGKEEPVTYPEPIRVAGNETTTEIAEQEEMNDYSARGGNE